METTQMNIRINPALKERGDAVFKQLGWSPSEAVRAFWSFADAHADDPQLVAKAVVIPANRHESQQEDFVKEAQSIVSDFAREHGFALPQEYDYEKLRDQVHNARLDELEERCEW